MKNVLFLFGINGVGKSTIAEIIVRSVPGAVHVSGSAALREAFGGISRDELERMDAATKHGLLRDTLVRSFLQHESVPLVVCDTHLTVAIRRNGAVTHEQMWDRSYARFGRSYWNIIASGIDVLRRRRDDEIATGRKRTLDASAISLDAEVNDEAFRTTFAGMPNAHVLRNGSSVEHAAQKVLRDSSRVQVAPQSADNASA